MLDVRILELDQGFTLRQLVEPEADHRLTFSQDGIVHDSGVAVAFEPDMIGHIQRLVAPDGAVQGCTNAVAAGCAGAASRHRAPLRRAGRPHHLEHLR